MASHPCHTADRTPVEGPLWRAMLNADTPMSIAELHTACAANPNAIQHRLKRWEKAGLISRINERPLRFVMTDLVKSPRADMAAPHCANPADDAVIPLAVMPPHVTIDGRLTPRRRSQRARLWSWMRVKKRFDLVQLIIGSGATRCSAEDYLNCLQRAGYIRCVERGNPRRGTWSVFQLVHITGPRAPAIRRRRIAGRTSVLVIDRNTGAVIDISPDAVSLRAARADSAAAAPLCGGEG